MENIESSHLPLHRRHHTFSSLSMLSSSYILQPDYNLLSSNFSRGTATGLDKVLPQAPSASCAPAPPTKEASFRGITGG